jgi:hypothetical protein
MAECKDAVFAANSSASTAMTGPSTVTTFGRSGVCGESVMVAARAQAVASRIEAIEKRRRIDAGYHICEADEENGRSLCDQRLFYVRTYIVEFRIANGESLERRRVHVADSRCFGRGNPRCDLLSPYAF